MIVLGGLVFRSKVGALAHVRHILAAHVPGDRLVGGEAAVILGALQRHPACSDKVGPGVCGVGIYSNGSTRSGHGFGVERLDGTVARFSYHRCFEAAVRSHADRVLEAFRHTVRPHILLWRDRVFMASGGQMNCPETGESIDPQRCHVDHAGPTFAGLVNSFLLNEGAAMDSIKVAMPQDMDVETTLADAYQKLRWIRFHNSHCRLRIMSVEGHKRRHVPSHYLA